MIGLAIFARDPAERGKTRLQLDPTSATELYEAMLADVVGKLAQVRAPLSASLWYAHGIGPDFGLPTRAQKGDGLGARMRHAFATMLATHSAVIIVGSDSPTLPARCIDQAVSALEHHDLVLGPSADGGYYLIGARRVPSFDDVRWSCSTTFADTAAANDGAHALEPWYDVDRPDDLRLLATHLALDPAAAPRTAAAIRRRAEELW